MKRWTCIVKMLDGTHLVFRGRRAPRLRAPAIPFDDAYAAVCTKIGRAAKTALFREVAA